MKADTLPRRRGKNHIVAAGCELIYVSDSLLLFGISELFLVPANQRTMTGLENCIRFDQQSVNMTGLARGDFTSVQELCSALEVQHNWTALDERGLDDGIATLRRHAVGGALCRKLKTLDAEMSSAFSASYKTEQQKKVDGHAFKQSFYNRTRGSIVYNTLEDLAYCSGGKIVGTTCSLWSSSASDCLPPEVLESIDTLVGTVDSHAQHLHALASAYIDVLDDWDHMLDMMHSLIGILIHNRCVRKDMTELRRMVLLKRSACEKLLPIPTLRELCLAQLPKRMRRKIQRTYAM